MDDAQVRGFIDEFDVDIVVTADCSPILREGAQLSKTSTTFWRVWCDPCVWRSEDLELVQLSRSAREAASVMFLQVVVVQSIAQLHTFVFHHMLIGIWAQDCLS